MNKISSSKNVHYEKRPPHIIPPQKKVTIKKVDVYQEKYVHGDCRCKRRFWGRFSFCWKHIAKCYNISEVAEIACGARWCAITCNVWPWYDMRPWENKQTTMIWDHEKNKPTWYEIMMWEKFLAWKLAIWRQKHLNTPNLGFSFRWCFSGFLQQNFTHLTKLDLKSSRVKFIWMPIASFRDVDTVEVEIIKVLWFVITAFLTPILTFWSV